MRHGWDISLRDGLNDLVFRGRGLDFSAELSIPDRSILLRGNDSTLPDIVSGERDPVWAALLVLNATTTTARNLSIVTRVGSEPGTTTPVSNLLPLTPRKVGFRIQPPLAPSAGPIEVDVQLQSNDDTGQSTVMDELTISLNVRQPHETRRVTFRSQIDGSIQYYAVKPAQHSSTAERAPALVLSLHGAGVQAVNQANSYAAKTWAHIVAPTNRRPYGFNWEFIGQRDALEVLEDARARFPSDRARTYLTGHSMGGHGTWHLGQTFPDQFAAIAPSAGWVTMGRYGSRGRQLPENPSKLDRLMQRPANPNNTDKLLKNCGSQAVYILHGTDDRSVPASHAQHMSESLALFHRDFTYHEQPAVGHWWDVAEAAGVDCVDWLPMFELFARRTIPSKSEVRRVSFVTANPGRSPSSYWLTIEDQIRALDFSSVDIQSDPHRRVVFGKTDNVRRLRIELSMMQPDKSITLILDGQELRDVEWPGGGQLVVQKSDTGWSVSAPASLASKGPHRYGPFRAAFDHQFQLVYGTQGTPQENRALLAKVRYDCETYWVGGNGSVDAVADTEFDSGSEPDRNVILYGNADTNAAWHKLLANCPVEVRRGAVLLGDRTLSGNALASTFIHPRPGSNRALVGAIGVTGPRGFIPTFHLGYLGPSIDYPDCTVWRENGTVAAAGFFGSDWSIETGEFEIDSTN